MNVNELLRLYQNWILDRKLEDVSILKEDDDHIVLENQYGKGTVSFTTIDENTIITELMIEATKNQEVEFYLHFELKDEEHAKELYLEMEKALIQLKEKRTLQVLLSCSAGLTTSMFAESLNQAASQLSLDCHFNAVSYSSIYEEASNYDVIMIAPQIGYMYAKLKEGLNNKLVLQIPAQSFAKYDAFGVITFMLDEIKKYIEFKKTEKEKYDCQLAHDLPILSIVVMPNRAQTRLYYRLYKNGEIIDSNLIIRGETNFNDIDDIIDTMLAKNGDIHLIGLAIPGVVSKEGLYSFHNLAENFDLKGHLEDKYKVNVLIENNVNAAVVGFALSHPEYHNIIFHSQPFGFANGGQGIYINDKLIRGKRGIAGEVRLYLERMQLSNRLEQLVWSEQGVLELVTKSLLPTIVAFGPDAVVLRSPLTSDMNEVKKILSSFIPEDYLPEFFYVKEASGLMLDGLLKLCVDSIDE